MYKLALAMVILLFAIQQELPAQAQWSNSRGGPERDGTRVGTAKLSLAQVSWRHRLGGGLSTTSLLSINDGTAPQVAIVAGGRVSVKHWDDSLNWRGDLSGLKRFLGNIDIDGDGTTDLLLATGGRTLATLLGYTPNGVAAFTGQSGIIGQVTSGARVVDLDGDGFREIYLASTSRGPNDDIAVVYRFPAGNVAAGEIAYTIKATNRDYAAGFYDVIGEFDGTPGLEILALGHRNMYLYDGATGTLESTTTLSGFVPYGRSTLRITDLNGDGQNEVFAFSNQQWTPANNRRHVTLLAHNGTQMTEVWSLDLGGADDRRLAFSDSSVADLDGGDLEVVFAVRDPAGTWTTEIRAAATGALLATLTDERFHDTATTSAGTFIFTADDNRPTKVYQFSRALGLQLVADLGMRTLVSCQQPTAEIVEAPRAKPCAIPQQGEARRGLIFAERTRAGTSPTNGPITAMVVLDSGDGFNQTGRFDAGEGTLSAALEMPPGYPAVLAIAHSDGVLHPLNEQLAPIDGSTEPSWAGVRYGSLAAGTDLPAFPLALGRGDGQAEHIVTLLGSGRVAVLDASNEPKVTGGVEVVWTKGTADRLVIDTTNVPNNVVALNRRGAIQSLNGADGQELWRRDDAFSVERPLHSDPVHYQSDTRNEIWYHRSGSGTFDLTALDLETGNTVLFNPSLDQNNGGWKRLSVATWDGEPAPLSGRLNQVWRYASDGTVADTYPTPVASLVIPVTRPGQNPLLIIDGLTQLSVFDPSTTTTRWSLPRVNRGGPRRGALLHMGSQFKYATADATGPKFRVFDIESGAIDVSVNLVAGAILPADAPLPNPAPNLANVTALTDITGNGDPAFLVGSSDGFVYAISAADGTLIWSLDIDAGVDEIIASDWDGDGELELVASATDGTLVGLDTYTGKAPIWVIDTDYPLADDLGPDDDIDEISTFDKLYAAWAPVEGATSYQVAVFRDDNSPVTPGFSDVGNRTSVVIRNLDLEDGVRYIVSVRAITSLGTSVDMPSDGVIVHLEAPPGHSGCCRVSPPDETGGNLILALFAALFASLVTRRRRSVNPR